MRQYELIRNEEGGDVGGGASTDSDAIDDPSTPPTFDASGIFDSDGRFGDIGSRYQSDDIDADFINRNFKGKSPTEVAQILKNNQIAARAKSIAYPGADASSEDIQRFREAAGVPEEVSQVMPEDFESFQNATGWTQEVATPVIQALIDANTPGPAIAAGLAAVQQAAAAQAEAWIAESQEAKEAGRQEVMQAFGPNAQDKINAAAESVERLGINAGISRDAIDQIKQTVTEMSNPALTRMMAHLGGAIADAQYRGPGQSAQVDEFRGPRETAIAIMEDDNHPMHAKFMAGDSKVNAYVDELLAKAASIK